MKILTTKKQREIVARLIAIRRITSSMMNEVYDESNFVKWAENMESLADNIIEIADIVGGIPALTAIQSDIDKEVFGKQWDILH